MKTLYTVIHEHGAYAVHEIPVKKWHANSVGSLVFINGQHYSTLFRSLEEATNLIHREGAYHFLTPSELIDLLARR